MSVSPFSVKHVEALELLVAALERSGAWYRATGGLAGNLHGSTWPLHDIDVDYRGSEWPGIEEALRPYLVSGPQSYTDDEFRLTMAVARIAGVDVELCQLEGCFVNGPTGLHLLDADPRKRERRTAHGLTMWTMPLDDLIFYKELLGRSADLSDLRKIAASREST